MERLTTAAATGHYVSAPETTREARPAGSLAVHLLRLAAAHFRPAGAVGCIKAALAVVCLLVSTARSPAAAGCDSTVDATLTATNLVLSVLSSNTAGLLFRLPVAIGTPINLGLTFSGTAQNGVDVEALPASVLIPGNKSLVAVTVKPKPSYPFASKSLTVTISSCDYPCVVPGSPRSATITLVGFDPPQLEAARLDSSRIALSWWVPVVGYRLESATEPLATNWLTVTGAPMGVQGSNSFTLTNAGSAQFYRLMKP